MITLNFFGDFIASSEERLSMDEALRKHISVADLNIINFEAPAVSANCFDPTIKSGPVLCQSPDSPSWLEENGFDVVSLANNHIMDYGTNGLYETKKAFEKSLTVGAGSWEEAYKPVIVEVKAKKIAIFALSQLEFGNLADEWDVSSKDGVAWINHPKVDVTIQQTRQKADYLIVYAHAGLEHAEQPLPEWRDRYRQLIDMGCDAVIASHPHIAQGWEYYHGCPIVYSLGNFYFSALTGKSSSWYRSLCASLFIEDRKISINMTPLQFSKKGISVCHEEEFAKYLTRVNEVLSDSNAYMTYVNGKCQELESSYYSSFVKSGLGRILNWRDTKSYLGLRLRNPSSLSVAPLLNMIRCETHRWCLLRAMKLKNKEIL